MSHVSNITVGQDPQERLTRIAQAASSAAEDHPEADGGEIVIVMIRDTGTGRQAIALSGAGDQAEGINEVIGMLLANVEALCRSIGRPFSVATADPSGN
jgi:hypothetical protein